MFKQPKQVNVSFHSQNSHNVLNKQQNLLSSATPTPRIDDTLKTSKPLQNLSNIPTRTQEDQVKRTQPRSPIRQTFEKKSLENKSCIQIQDEKAIPKILQRGKSPQQNQAGRNIQNDNQLSQQLEKQSTQQKQQTQYKQNEPNQVGTNQLNSVKSEQNINKQQICVQQKQETKLQIQSTQRKTQNNLQQQQRPKTAITSQLQLKQQGLQDQLKPIQKDQNSKEQQEIKQQLIQNKKQEQPIKGRQQQQQRVEQVVEEKLYKCTEGCGRSFNAKALEKHSKVCKKVFQQKRKVFNSQKQRQIEGEECGQMKGVGMKRQMQKQGIKQSQRQQQIKNDKPNWKAQSDAFRAIIRQAKGQRLTKDQQTQLNGVMESVQQLVQCKFCNRKFNVETAKKHIVFCETKVKQCGKSGIQKKKK